MKRLLVGTLGLSLGWSAGLAAAEELVWRPVTPPTAAAQPTAPGQTNPAVTLGRPVALVQKAQAITDAAVRFASYTAAAPGSQPRVVRGQSPEGMPQRLPDLFDLKVDDKPPAKPLAATNYAANPEPAVREPQVSDPAVREPVGVPGLLITEEKAAEPIAPPRSEKVPAAQTAPLPNLPTEPVAETGPAQKPTIVSPPPTDAVHPPCCDETCCGEWKAASECCPATTSTDRLYARGEYLWWWLRDTRVPPLITTGPVSSQGILGRNGTVLLLGGSALSNEDHSGGRLTVGYWLDDCQTVALEASFFVLPDRSAVFPFNSNQFPLLARPFFNLNLGREDAEIGTLPGISTGSITATLASQLWGANADFRGNLCSGCNYRVDLLGGFRYLDLRESLQITEDLSVLPTSPILAGSHIIVNDRFATHNQFYGAEVGTVSEYHLGRWSAEVRARIGLGNTHQVVDINGFQTITSPTGTVTAFNGGLLALPTNIGRTSRDHFTVVPQVGLNVGYQITDHLRVFAGYDFLWWSNVLRPGDQIDRALDVTLIPNFRSNLLPTGQVRPAVPLKETSFWAQGVNLGLEFRY
jgi:hypothetical protein